MPKTDERQVIRDAMDRLLTGKPIRSSGALNVVTLAAEAGVKRHFLTHKHTDLRDEFYDRVRNQGHVPQSEVALRQKLSDLEARIVRLRDDNSALAAEVALLRRMNNVLSVEKERAESAFRGAQSGRVAPIFGGPSLTNPSETQ